MSIVKTRNLEFDYIRRDEEGNVESVVEAIKDVSMDVLPGDFIAILGSNGSGKSTLAKHFNAILTPTEGTVWVDGMDTTDEARIWDIRQEAGMVFQNPDNQIIGQVVEEDVGFGPENMGVPTEEIWERVEESLKAVGMYAYRKHSPSKLSGGQKQRVSIAGVLAMHPKCIILDEPTAMLDPGGRKEVIRAVRALNDVERVTVILITHYMEEIVYADKVFVMDHGKVAMEGTPREIFAQTERLRELRLDVPKIAMLGEALREGGLQISKDILSAGELADALAGPAEKKKDTDSADAKPIPELNGPHVSDKAEENLIILDHVSYIYGPDTPLAVRAVDDMSLVIPAGSFVGLIGHTGSGKSTLVQQLNGLIKPTSGHIYFKGKDIHGDGFSGKELRSKVGLVFQYPEHQLFEADVFSDVCFGPKNLGLDQKEVELRAFEALHRVGMEESVFYQSPFDLSGGQMRRVAIAGVLAMKPEMLVLDEPTAGLDPKGREEILQLITKLHKESGMTVLLVSHSMDDVAEYVDRLLVMDNGKLVYDDSPENVFRHVNELKRMGLSVPQVTDVLHELKRRGLDVDTGAVTVETAAAEILKAKGQGK